MNIKQQNCLFSGHIKIEKIGIKVKKDDIIQIQKGNAKINNNLII